MRKYVLPVLVCALICHSKVAIAHEVVMHLFAGYDVIEGEVGFAGGEMMAFARVDIFDEQKHRLGVVATDKDGVFKFKPTKCATHVFRSNLGAGHVLEQKVLKVDLPRGVPDCAE